MQAITWNAIPYEPKDKPISNNRGLRELSNKWDHEWPIHTKYSKNKIVRFVEQEACHIHSHGSQSSCERGLPPQIHNVQEIALAEGNLQIVDHAYLGTDNPKMHPSAGTDNPKMHPR